VAQVAKAAKATILEFPESENREINREFLLFCPRAAVLDVDFRNFFKTLQVYSLLECWRRTGNYFDVNVDGTVEPR
jgi:hypothetical protein